MRGSREAEVEGGIVTGAGGDAASAWAPPVAVGAGPPRMVNGAEADASGPVVKATIEVE